LTDAASKGNIRQGLVNAASYTKVTNQAFADGLAKSRNRFLNNLDSLFGSASSATTQDELLEELQEMLLQADLGVATSEDIVNEVRSLSLDKKEEVVGAVGEGKKKEEIISREDLMSIMRGVLIETLDLEKKDKEKNTATPTTMSKNDDGNDTTTPATIVGASAIRFASKQDKIPTVLFVMGANGMGKTTTIGKLANRLRIEGNQKVLMAACDVFRAGAVDQLQMWADKAEVDLIGPSKSGASSPTSIIGNALDKAIAEGYDTVLVDTAGRLSNNWELNEELVKMKKMIQEKLSTNDNNVNPDDVPHETLLVVDAAQGRTALDSAQIWNKEVGLTGLVLTKLDGSARGGSVVAISRDLNVPVKLIGVGEGIDDLRDFEGEKFVDGLLGIGSAGGKSSSEEGEKLASRLESMRRERAKRTPDIAKVDKRSPVGAGSMRGGDDVGTFNHVSPQSSVPPTRNVGNKKKKRRKKGKKGKR